MKAATFTVFSLIALAACTKQEPAGIAPPAPAPVVADAAHDSRNALDWAGSYRGVLPCADCEGIDTTVTLGQGTFETRSRYLGKAAEPVSAQGSFSWDAAGTTVTLAGDPPMHYRVGENRLTQLALDGSPISGDLASYYVLKKVPEGLAGKQWRLVELRGQPLPPLERAPFLVFDTAESRVSGFGGCNSLTGAVVLEQAAARIRFEKVAATLRACVEGMDVEQAFNEMLAMVDNYSLQGDRLSLNRARMAPLARFEAAPPQ